MRILFTSVGRRVELVQSFRKAANDLQIELTMIGADITEDAPALYFCDETKLVCRIKDINYIPQLLSICEREKVDCLIPTIDTDLLLLAENKKRFESIGTTAKELCDICDEDKAAISRSILYLEREGYIVCNSDAPKRYKSLLCLTEKGLETGKVIAQKIDGILSRTGDGMTEEEMAIFYKCLGVINNNLQNICNDYRDNKYLKNEL